jgi:hypothetical protein
LLPCWSGLAIGGDIKAGIGECASLRIRDGRPAALPRIMTFPFILLSHALTGVQAGILRD